MLHHSHFTTEACQDEEHWLNPPVNTSVSCLIGFKGNSELVFEYVSLCDCLLHCLYHLVTRAYPSNPNPNPGQWGVPMGCICNL